MALTVVLVAVLCCTSIYFYPEHGITIANSVALPKIIWRVFVQGVLMLTAYKVFYAKPAQQPRYIYFSTTKKMRAHIVEAYGDKQMKLVDDHPSPKVVNPNDILVRVKAMSVNPIDFRLVTGHARATIDNMRRKKGLPYGGDELPLVLGRDCSGVVEAVGSGVTKFNVGDEVYLSVSAADTPGTLAELVLAKEFMVAKKPQTLDHSQATAFPFAYTTVWRALVDQCGLGPQTTAGKRVLVLAGTGGLGTLAIQLVKAWGGHVTTTCSTEGIPLVEKLGADDVIDYKMEEFDQALQQREKFDVAFITLGGGYLAPCMSALKKGGRASTVVAPFYPNLNKYGKIGGTLANIGLVLKWKITDFWYDRTFGVAFNEPNGQALEHLATLIDQKKVQPVIQRTFEFEEANEALAFIQRGHSRGKTVIVMPKDQSSAARS